MLKHFLFSFATLFSIGTAYSQCLEWVNPAPDSAYELFENQPCTGDTVLFEGFSVWQSDAYLASDLTLGAVYEFNICQGASANSWTADYTVIAPSGAVDAFGAGEGCSIQWTASESGDYTIAVNEADNCGIENTDDNGFPSLITISGGADCPPPPVFVEGAESFEQDSLRPCWVKYDTDGDSISWFVDSIPGAFEGTRIVRSNSFSSSGGQLFPDNYLVTPPLVVGPNDSLYYVVRAEDPDFPNEFYSIEIAFGGNQSGDFTEIFSETLTSAEWEGRSIDLSEYEGSNVYIAFRHQTFPDQSAIFLDAISLPGEVVVNCENVLSSENPRFKNGFTVYPNPSKGSVRIDLPEKTPGITSLSVFDLFGKAVYQSDFQGIATQEVDLSELPAGLYILRVENGGVSRGEKLILQ